MVSYTEIETAVYSVLDEKLTLPGGMLLREFTDAVCSKVNVADKTERAVVATRAKNIAASEGGKYLLCGTKIYSRQLFFNHTQFRVVPTKFEVEHGVLLIGADFAPFSPLQDYDRALMPSDVELFFADGTPAKPLRIEMDFPDVENVYYMLGRSEMIDVFSGEDERNRTSMMNATNFADVHLVMPGFDMATFYKENKVQEGDALVVEVLDWDACRYSIKKQMPDMAPDKGQQDKFVRILESALTKETELSLDCNGISDQIATAYFLAFEAGDDLRFSPWVSVAEYRFRMCDIDICVEDSEWSLVPYEDECGDECGCHEHDMPDGMSMDPDITPDGFSISSGVISGLGDILQSLHAPLNMTEVTAMIFSDLSSGNDSADLFYDNLIDLMQLKFADEGQDVVFHNEMDELWEQCLETYTPMADEGRGELRDRVLEIVNDRVGILRDVQANYGEAQIPKSITNKSNHLRTETTEMLTLLLNPQYEIEPGNGLYNQILTQINNVESEWDRFVESLGLE